MENKTPQDTSNPQKQNRFQLLIIVLFLIAIVILLSILFGKNTAIEIQGPDGVGVRVDVSSPDREIAEIERELNQLRKNEGDFNEILNKETQLLRLYKDSLGKVKFENQLRINRGQELLEVFQRYDKLSRDSQIELLSQAIDYLSPSRMDSKDLNNLATKILRSNDQDLRTAVEQTNELLKRENELLKSQLAEAKKRINFLEREVTQLNQQLITANNTITDRNLQIAQLTNAYNDTQGHLQNLIQDVNTLNADRRHLIDSLTLLGIDLVNLENIDSLNQIQIDSLSAQFKALKDENSQLEDEISKQDEQIATFEPFKLDYLEVSPPETKRRPDGSFPKKLNTIEIKFKISPNFQSTRNSEPIKIILISPKRKGGYQSKLVKIRAAEYNKPYTITIEDDKTKDDDNQKFDFGKGNYTVQLIHDKSKDGKTFGKKDFFVR